MSTKEGDHVEEDHIMVRPTLIQALANLGQILSTHADLGWIDARADSPRGGARSTTTR